MKLSELRGIAESQRAALDANPFGLERECLADFPDIRTHALVVSGIRRCGKSTLLHQVARRLGEAFFYLNFEDIRLSGIGIADYRLLDTLIDAAETPTLFLDEVQMAPEWDRFVRHALDAGRRVVLTGSNASLLSRELGSSLTGRHLQEELFPFSWAEYCRFREVSPSGAVLERYLAEGGFPEYLKTGNPEILRQLQQDILARDIAVRFNIRDDRALRNLYLWLISNVGNLMTPSRLTGIVGVKSPTTVLEYLAHLEAAWMIHTVPRFAWSVKARSLAPKKVYAADPGCVHTSSLSTTPDRGRLLENVVYLELRRRTASIFYLAEKNTECDFVVAPQRGSATCIQVCWTLTSENENREIGGLRTAMEFFGVDTGVILTADQEDEISVPGGSISVVPLWRYDIR
ncbi:MAG: ATP-binding protein [Spirochaetaceae bacterium]|nr:MAG: ATP-binding protein [Spirochaetaceae bacterium]